MNKNIKLIFGVLSLTVVFVVLAISCDRSSEKKAETPVNAISDDWESIKTYPVAEWFEDSKFGIFIHWGVYAVPGWVPHHYAEWYPNRLYKEAEIRKYHEDNFGLLPEFGYADFVPMFKAEKWDPAEWAELFKASGARYVVPVAEHHDGFAMWDSELTHWDAKEKGPKRDIIGELEVEVRKLGMKYAPSFHRERHFEYFDSVAVAQEIKRNPEFADLYGPFSLTDEFIEDYVDRWKELEEKYQPDFMWLDHVPVFYNDSASVQTVKYKEAVRGMIADYLSVSREWEKEVYFNNKGRETNGINFPLGAGVREADNLVMEDLSIKWQNPATIAYSYGYNRLEEEKGQYKSANQLIDLLVDVVSKNGNLLLNVGPKPDGTIPPIQVERLREIGEWLSVNGEAIYGTRPWKVAGEGPSSRNSQEIYKEFSSKDIRYTTNGNILYAIVMDWPEDKIMLSELASSQEDELDVKSVSLLGQDGFLKWNWSADGLEIYPGEKPGYNHAFPIKIVFN